MAYANANIEVKGYTGFPLDYSSTTMPTLAQVTDIITQVEGEIDVALGGLGITTPITNVTLLANVRKYSGMGSAGLTLQRYGKNENDFRLADWFYSKFETWIDKLTTDEQYQNNIKETIGTDQFTGVYVESNVTDGSHTYSTPVSTKISYGVEGFR